MKKLLILALAAFIAVSCKEENGVEKTISQIRTDISIERFDQFFGNANTTDLPKLKQAYPFMFSTKFKDSFWIAKIKDTLQQELTKEVGLKYAKIDSIETAIESLFNHIKYYFPEFTPPRVITTTSNVDYRSKVVVTDTIVLVALDNYLGNKHHFYQNIPKFIKRNFESERIAIDVALAYTENFIHQPQRKTLLDEMIYFGKQLYLLDVLLPNVTESERLGYTEEELHWARANEAYIWRYYIERELLYSTDTKLPNRFINPAPFSKFYLEEIDTDSPGRIGQYIGLQIVRAYMQHNNVSLRDMLRQKPEDIFKTSKFKPRK
ncbi:gliding motility lipoprotein GldB [Flavobacteriaceae bacterium MHTCC 0001]